MATQAKSRWADSEEDAALVAKLKKEKENKRRQKAARAQKLEEKRLAQPAFPEAKLNDQQDDLEGRPPKRRKFTPENERKDSNPKDRKPLRFRIGHWGECRSVENFDKLNDIEEGTYGWVARAKEIATGKVVALKRLKIDSNDRNGLPITGLREIQTLKDCQHGNIVRLQEVVVGENASRIEKYAQHSPPSRSISLNMAAQHLSCP
jgi:cell division cycle 2-like